MGQLAYVISRVAGVYRCIAAIYVGETEERPVIHTNDFLKLVKNPLNARIVRAEISALEKGTPWSDDECAPCPYITHLLRSAWGLNPDNIYGAANKVYVLDVRVSCGMYYEKWNADISVVDITPCRRPGYCHAFMGGVPVCDVDGMEVSVDLPIREPLSGAQYVRAWYPEPSTSRRAMLAITLLEHERIISLSTLAEIWPKEFQEQLQSDVAEAEGEDETAVVVEKAVPPLIDLTLRRLIQQAVEEGDTHAILEMIDLQLADKAAFIVSTLREISPFATDAGATILARALSTTLKGTDRTLYLRDFHLSPSQLMHVITAQEGLYALSLGDIPITADILADILTAKPSIERVDLLDCPALSATDLCTTLSARPAAFARVSSILHPVFLASAPTMPSPFVYLVVGGRSRALVAQPVLATPKSIVRCLAEYFRWVKFADTDRYTGSFMEDWTTTLALFGSPELVPGQDFASRAVLAIPSFGTINWSAPGPTWVFAMHIPESIRGGEDVWHWAFLHVEKVQGERADTNTDAGRASDPRFPPDAIVTPYDLSGFLKIFSEGREPAPADEVAALQTLVDWASLPFQWEPRQCGFRLMDETYAQRFVKDVNAGKGWKGEDDYNW